MSAQIVTIAFALFKLGQGYCVGIECVGLDDVRPGAKILQVNVVYDFRFGESQ